MFEANNGSVQVSDLASALATIEALQAEVASVRSDLSFMLDRNQEKQDRLEKARDLIEPLIVDDTIESTSQLASDLCETLGIKLTEVIDVTFTVTFTGLATVPKGTEASDLDLDINYWPEITLCGDTVGSASHDGTDIEGF